jgi:hypothetical protein
MLIKKVVFVLTTLLTFSIVLADSSSKEEKSTNFIITPSVAYRYDVFKWSIPDSYLPDKKVSELVWKNRILQPSIKIEIEPKPNQFTFSGQVKYGYILKNPSKSRDLDWIHNNHTLQLYSKTKSAVKGNIFDLSGVVGYSLGLLKESLLTFYVGYDYSDYRNKNYGSHQLLSYRGIPFSSNELVQKYYFKTQTPWVGLSFNAPLNEIFTIIPTIKFYSFKHIGKGYWVRRYDLKQNPSLKNNAKGTGLGFDMDFAYKYSNNLDLTLNLETKRFKMKKGQNQAFFNSLSPEGERDDNGKLFDLSLMSSSISAGLKYKL